MAINFPNSPNVGDSHTANDLTWKWDGTTWKVGITTINAATIPGISTSGTSTFYNLDVANDVSVGSSVTAVKYYGDGSSLGGITATTSSYAAVAGVATVAQNLTGTPDITINDIASRHVNSSGVVTATSFVGDGSSLTGVVASGTGVVIKDSNSVVGTAGTINFGLNLSVTPVSSGIVTVSTAGGVKDNGSWTASAGSLEQLDSIATTNLVIEYILYFSHSTGKQAQKVLVLNNGSNSYSQEFGVVFDNNLLVSVGSSIFGGNLTLNATPESGITGTIDWKFLRNDVS
tara:strand:- start:9494 stop:10357 length:864 start_codon:yes stop_codon:yes gene_type:complete